MGQLSLALDFIGMDYLPRRSPRFPQTRGLVLSSQGSEWLLTKGSELGKISLMRHLKNYNHSLLLGFAFARGRHFTLALS